jgi:hypothetical protein
LGNTKPKRGNDAAGFWIVLSVAILSPLFTLAENAINPQMSKGKRVAFRFAVLSVVLTVAVVVSLR